MDVVLAYLIVLGPEVDGGRVTDSHGFQRPRSGEEEKQPGHTQEEHHVAEDLVEPGRRVGGPLHLQVGYLVTQDLGVLVKDLAVPSAVTVCVYFGQGEGEDRQSRRGGRRYLESRLLYDVMMMLYSYQ